jgi:hypothetical protein
VNWSVIFRHTHTDTQGTKYLEWFNSALHGWTAFVASPFVNHLRLVPPAVSSKTGVEVSALFTNQVLTEPKSSFEDTNFANYFRAVGATSQAQVDIDTDGVDSIPHGDKAIRITKNGTTQNFYPIYDTGKHGIAVLDNEVRTASITLGVPTTGVTTQFQLKYSQGTGAAATNSSIALDFPILVVVQPGEWVEVSMPPTIVNAADDDFLGLLITATVDVGTLDFMFDKVQMSDASIQPSPWQVGGTPRASAVYDLNWNTAEKATHIFTFSPFAQSIEYDAIPGDYYIRSWRISATAYGELYYDSTNQLFSFNVVDAGTNEVFSTDARWFKKDQPIVFAIQFGVAGANSIVMSVGHGRTIETITSANADHTGFGLSDILVRWGDKDAASGMNGKIVDLDFTGVMTSDDLVAYIDDLIG